MSSVVSASPSDPGVTSMVVARRKELTFPVTPEWKSKVRGVLRDRGRGSLSRLAEEVGCSTGQLTELLNADSQYSHLVARVNEALGWPPPVAPSSSKDSGEIAYVFDRMTPDQQQMILDAMEIAGGQAGDEAKVALAAMLRAFRKTH